MRNEPKFRGHDGKSYEAMKAEASAEKSKLAHLSPNDPLRGLLQRPKEIPMSAAHDEGRADTAVTMGQAPSNPIPGSDWSVDAYSKFPADDVAEMNAAVSAQIAKEIVDAGGPRASGFNYGGGNTKLPSIYFDGVRLEATMNRLAQRMSTAAWEITTAVRNVRLAETPTEKRMTETKLRAAMEAAMQDRDVSIAYKVDEIADTIEGKVPEPKGYVPHIGIHYELRPIRNAIRNLRNLISGK